MKTLRYLTVATAVSASAIITPAAAQDGALDNLSFGVGAFVSIQPLYEGSDEYGVRGIPFAFPTFGDSTERSRVGFKSVDDVRLSVFRRGGFDVGPVVGYSFGRKESLSQKLSGLGDVEGGIVLGAFGSYTALGGYFVEAAFSTQLTGGSDNGFIVDLDVGQEVSVSERLTLRANLGAEYASENYMNRYFSVSPAQALNSSYGAFDAEAGFKNISVGASLNFEATEKLSLRAGAGYSRLIGDAANSPISESNNQFGGSLGFVYRF